MSQSSPNDNYLRRHLRFNLTVNLLDGGFFGFAFGFASIFTIIPLFVSQMTDSALLIGLIPAIHGAGWQLPQLFTAGWVSRARRYKPLVLWATIHERLPFFGLALVAWYFPRLGTQLALVLTFALLVWQGLGGGFTANAWTSLISKIMPGELHGTFFGAQSAAFSGLEGVAAILAGLTLDRLDGPLDFTICFLVATLALLVSIFFLALTREPDSHPDAQASQHSGFWTHTRRILRQNHNFNIFLGVRSLAQFAGMGFSFYIIYAVWHFGISELVAGYMTGTFLVSTILASMFMGRLADNWSPRHVMSIGALAAAASAVTAWLAPSANWFYLSLVLASMGIVAIWTIPIPLSVRFGNESERPYYIGISNTFAAPATILAPILGGWLADVVGFQATFLVSALSGLLMAILLTVALKDPPHQEQGFGQPAMRIPME
jgi:MFS family permease